MQTLSREHWFPLLGVLRYATDTFAAESQASEDVGVIAIHGALTVLHDMAESHVGGVRPTGMTSTLNYQPPMAPDQTRTLTLRLFPVTSSELVIEEEEPLDETLPALPDDGGPKDSSV